MIKFDDEKFSHSMHDNKAYPFAGWGDVKILTEHPNGKMWQARDESGETLGYFDTFHHAIMCIRDNAPVGRMLNHG
tara:strand:+ start:809 stop:1036 length:228 start_codon:yes stop_codon:yes gene_type:complete